MSNPNIVGRPDVASSPNGRIPSDRYNVRFVNAKLTTSGAGYRTVHAKIEIVAPDLVPDPANPEIKLQVAGRKGDVYITVDPSSKAFAGWYMALVTLGLQESDGTLNLDKVVDALKTGDVFCDMLLDSEEEIARQSPAPGQARHEAPPIMGADGKPIKSGWRLKYIGAQNILARTDSVPGLPPAANGPF